MVTCLMTNGPSFIEFAPYAYACINVVFHHRFRHKSEDLYPSRNAYLVRKSLLKVSPSFSLITSPRLRLLRPFPSRRIFSLLSLEIYASRKIIVFMEHMANKNIHWVIGRHFTTGGQYGSNGGCFVWEDNFAS